MALRIGVVGATGRMGTAVCAAVTADPDLELVGAVVRSADPSATVTVAGGLVVVADRDELAAAGAEVVVDVSTADGARHTARWCAAHGIHAVIGATGITDHDLDGWRTAFVRSHCLVVPNFSVGAVLMMRFAELAAPYFETAEIVELHHDAKADAPSGTALLTAARMAAASADWARDPTEHEVLAGARGGAGPAGIRVHSVRLRGLVAHQEVLLGTTGQTLTLRHDSYDRSSFMPGVLLACKGVADHPGVTVGLDPLLGL